MSRVNEKKKDTSVKKKLGFFEKYLTIWVALCILIGIVLGRFFPNISIVLNQFQYAHISIPIAICLFFMIYPIMVQIDFRRVIEAGKTPKPVALTLLINWGVTPFSMAFFAWLFMSVIWKSLIPSAMASEFTAGMILLGAGPCTAMVLVWSHLSKGNMGHTLVMVAINSLAMLFLYPLIAAYLLGMTAIPVPFDTIAFSVGAYVGIPLIAGYFSRKKIIKRKGREWFESHFAPSLHIVSIIALLITLVVLFSLQGGVILEQPLIIALIAVPLAIQTFAIFGLGYGLSKLLGFSYENAAPSAQVSASNNFEVAIAVAITVFGLGSGAALATVVGVLIEVPIMLSLVKICLKTRSWFPQN